MDLNVPLTAHGHIRTHDRRPKSNNTKTTEAQGGVGVWVCGDRDSEKKTQVYGMKQNVGGRRQAEGVGGVGGIGGKGGGGQGLLRSWTPTATTESLAKHCPRFF